MTSVNIQKISISLAVFIFSLALFIQVSLADERYYYLARWVWNDTNPDFQFWQAPYSDKVAGLLDLRSIPAQSKAGGTPEGFGLFVYNEPISDLKLVRIGNSTRINSTAVYSNVTGLVKTAIEARLNVTLSNVSLDDVIYSILTVLADPTGQQRWKPMIPSGKMMEVWIGGELVKSKVLVPKQSPEWENVKLILQENFKQIYSEDETLARKYLQTLANKYSVNYTEFLPVGYENVTPLSPSTVIGDTFVDTNGVALGSHTASGDNGGWGWQEYFAAPTIQSNALFVPGNTAGNRWGLANSALSTDDIYAQLKIIGWNYTTAADLFYGPVVRRNATSTNWTGYKAEAEWGWGATVFNLKKWVTGTTTNLGTSTQDPVVNDVLRVEADGSSITLKVNGITLVGPITDTAISGNLYSGVAGTGGGSVNNNMTWDDFEAGDFRLIPEFVSPTEANATTITVNHTYVNVSVTNDTRINTVQFEWNYTGKTSKNMTVFNTTNIIGVWRLDNDTKDYSGNVRDGTLQAGNCSTSVYGYFNGGCEIQSSNISISMGDVNAVDGLSQMTVSLWVKMKSTTGTLDSMVSKFSDDGAGTGWILEIGTVGTRILTAVGGNDYCETNSGVLDTNWHNIIWVYNGSQSAREAKSKTFVDGVQVFDDNCAGTWGTTLPSNALPLIIGNSQRGGRAIDATIDEVRIYNFAMDNDTIDLMWRSEIGQRNYTGTGNIFFMNFTNMVDGTYKYRAYVNTTGGTENSTEQRTLCVTDSTDCPVGGVTNSANITLSFSLTASSPSLPLLRVRLQTLSLDLTESRTSGQSLVRTFTNPTSLAETGTKSVTFPKQSAQSLGIAETIQTFLIRVKLIANSIDLTDTFTRLFSFTRSFTNSFALTDSIASTLTRVRLVTNAFNLTESITRLSSFTRSLTNVIDLTDNISTILTRVRLVTNAIDLTEAVERLFSFTRSLTNAINLTDAVERFRVFPRQLTQAFDLTESITRVITFVRSLTNAIDLTENIIRIVSFARSLTNALDLTDTITFSLNRLRQLVVAIDLNDAFTRLVSFTRGLTNSIDLTETFVTNIGRLREVTQALDITDNIQFVLTRVRLVTNALDLTETITRLASFTRSLTNTIDFTETIQSSLTRLRQITQALDIADNIQTLLTRVRLITNVIDITEVITRLASFTRSLINTMDITESITAGLGRLRQITQALDITDNIQVLFTRVRLITNAIDLTETITRLSSFTRSLTNAIDLTEAITSPLTRLRELAQALDITDNIQALFTRVRLVTNSMDITEVITKLSSFTRSLTNAIDLTEVITSSLTRLKVVTQSLDLTDNIQIILTRVRLVTNSINLTDAAQRVLTALRQLTNAIDLTDAITATLTRLRQTTNAIDLTDNIQTLLTRVRLVTNPIDLTETITRLISFTRSLTNAIDLTELAERFRALPRTVTNALDITDTITTAITRVRLVTNAIDLTDVFGRLLSFTRSVTNSFSLTDIVERIITTPIIQRPVTLAITFTETPLRLWQLTRLFTNPIDFIELSQRFIIIPRLATNALDITDNIQILFTRVRIITNAIDLTEAITRLVSFTRSITGTFSLTEAISKTVITPVIQRQVTLTIALNEVFERVQTFSRTLIGAIDVSEASERIRLVTRTVTLALDFIMQMIKQIIEKIISPPAAPAPAPSAPVGAPSLITKSFELDKTVIKVVLLPGQIATEFLSINNTGNADLEINILSEKIENFTAITEKDIIIKPGESKRIAINFFVDGKTAPDIYTGKIVVKGDSIQKEIVVIIEVESTKPLFDVKVEVPRKYKVISPGETVVGQVTILNFNFNKSGKVDVDLELGIKDTLGNTIINRSELIAVESQTSIEREFQIPSYIRDGVYVMFAKVTYDGETGTSTDTFELVSKVSRLPDIRMIIIFIVLSSALVIVGYYLYRKRKKKHERIRRLTELKEKLGKIEREFEEARNRLKK